MAIDFLGMFYKHHLKDNCRKIIIAQQSIHIFNTRIIEYKYPNEESKCDYVKISAQVLITIYYFFTSTFMNNKVSYSLYDKNVHVTITIFDTVYGIRVYIHIQKVEIFKFN